MIQVDPPPLLNSVGPGLQVTYLAHVKDLNFVQGGWGKNLVKAVFTFMNVYRRLAANSTKKHVKKGKCPKNFWPGL